MRTVLATIQSGRRAHLARQAAAVARLDPQPDGYLVVSMDAEPTVADGARTVHLAVDEDRGLPLAAARNLAIRLAVREHGAGLVILLDVDCLPCEDLVARYAAAAAARPEALLSGPVRYLPPGMPRGVLPGPDELALAPPHAGRPAPPPGALVPETRPELFWSLGFALTPAAHDRIGGFDEGYRGYGAEDTDFGRRAAAAGVPLLWVGGAETYHLHHPVDRPPLHHLPAIVANALRFHARWGDWPMPDHLQAFTERGWLRWRPDGDEAEITATGRAAHRARIAEQGGVAQGTGAAPAPQPTPASL